VGNEPQELRQRVQVAISAAVESVRGAAQARENVSRRRRREYTRRCAWCGRIEVEERFVEPDPRWLTPFRLTHGICPECVTELKRTGRSR
jgi:hypothetical protein